MKTARENIVSENTVEKVRKNIHLPRDVADMVTKFKEEHDITTDTKAIIHMIRIAYLRGDIFKTVELGHRRLENELRGH